MALLDRFFGGPSLTLRGEDVMLRLPEASDYDAWRTVREKSRAFLTPWEPEWPEGELTRSAYGARLKRIRQDARDRAGYSFFIFDEPSAVLVGGITLGQIRRGVAQTGVLGYWMGEPYAGAGRMKKALAAVCSHAFDVEGLHRLEAACLPRNARSIGLLQGSGFTLEGYLRKYLKIAGIWEDHQLYALLAEDWMSFASARQARRLAPDHERKAASASYA